MERRPSTAGAVATIVVATNMVVSSGEGDSVMKVVHKLRSVTQNGLVKTVTTRCGVSFFGLQEMDLKKLLEERTTEDPEKVTCKNCLRNV